MGQFRHCPLRRSASGVSRSFEGVKVPGHSCAAANAVYGLRNCKSQPSKCLARRPPRQLGLIPSLRYGAKPESRSSLAASRMTVMAPCKASAAITVATITSGQPVPVPKHAKRGKQDRNLAQTSVITLLRSSRRAPCRSAALFTRERLTPKPPAL